MTYWVSMDRLRERRLTGKTGLESQGYGLLFKPCLSLDGALRTNYNVDQSRKAYVNVNRL